MSILATLETSFKLDRPIYHQNITSQLFSLENKLKYCLNWVKLLDLYLLIKNNFLGYYWPILGMHDI